MLKYIVLALVGLGVYIGVTYKDQIEDLTNSRSFEDVQDVFEDVSDKASDTASELSEKFEELKQ
ncbi:YtxH domain-containing protein (plasmid) [Photobacterium sp. DA100]|uniref:YtxH domain-containing protein n=1 Tax=Photobacterium sp. DA100 TaxID=3027472 RepID=UPI002478DB33|nr:YtxH domain-containing protein [Photobacterium sp. DA100]WEM45564.1 YtxH domain-containing protein [Photobacterium sp. DA100]